MGPKLHIQSEGRKQWFNVSLKDTIVTAGDLNPHAGDQKHQSLNSVLLTARQRHFHKKAIYVYELLHWHLHNLRVEHG